MAICLFIEPPKSELDAYTCPDQALFRGEQDLLRLAKVSR
jgi:hypothetical protein